MENPFTRSRGLVIDDFPHMAMSVRRMLTELGIADVDLVFNGEEALKQMRKQRYEIVLCDYNLGDGRDGQQVLEEARLSGAISPAAVFMLITAETSIPYVLGAVEFQPDDYLAKPFTKEMLLTRLTRAAARGAELAAVRGMVVKGEIEPAIALCQQKLKEKNRYLADYARLMGELLLKLGQFERAVELYRKLLGRFQFGWAKLGLGRASHLAGSHQTAINTLQELIAENRLYVDAYDWLARALEAAGQDERAQQILEQATELSPKSVPRQRALGEAALRNDDLTTAGRAFSSAIRHGEFSVRRSAEEYCALADVMIRQRKGGKALQPLKKARSLFANENSELLQICAATAQTHHAQGNHAEAAKALAEAVGLYRRAGDGVTDHSALRLADAALKLGDETLAAELLDRIAQENHDDPAMFERVKRIAADSGLKLDFEQGLAAALARLQELNSEGVRLTDEGRLEEAIALFEGAAEQVPNNRAFNLNAAQALIMWMERHGGDDARRFRVRQLLARVERAGKTDERHRELTRMYERLD